MRVGDPMGEPVRGHARPILQSINQLILFTCLYVVLFLIDCWLFVVCLFVWLFDCLANLAKDYARCLASRRTCVGWRTMFSFHTGPKIDFEETATTEMSAPTSRGDGARQSNNMSSFVALYRKYCEPGVLHVSAQLLRKSCGEFWRLQFPQWNKQ